MPESLRVPSTPTNSPPTSPTRRGNSPSLQGRVALADELDRLELSPRPSVAAAAPAAQAEPRAPIGAVLDRASELLNAGKPREALAHLLAFPDKEAGKKDFGYQARLAEAHRNTLAEMDQKGELGSFELQPAADGDLLRPRLSSERLDHFVATIKAFDSFLEVVGTPAGHALLYSKNPAETADACMRSVRHGLGQAHLNADHFLNSIARVNMNHAYEASAQACLEDGRLAPDSEDIVNQARGKLTPHYAGILQASGAVNAAIQGARKDVGAQWLQIAAELRDQHGIKSLDKLPPEIMMAVLLGA